MSRILEPKKCCVIVVNINANAWFRSGGMHNETFQKTELLASYSLSIYMFVYNKSRNR
jgi:hypothetical protein